MRLTQDTHCYGCVLFSFHCGHRRHVFPISIRPPIGPGELEHGYNTFARKTLERCLPFPVALLVAQVVNLPP